jgi:hypothetical protein
MHDWLGWIDLTAGGAIAAAAALIVLVPPLRRYALAALGVAVLVLAIYRKGRRDEAEREATRREEAVRRAQEDYDEIDRRSDSAADVVRRLRDAGF